jgi:hypothetical protein
MQRTAMTELRKITIGTNPWSVPDPERALDGWLEGESSEEQIRQVRAKAQREREEWKPTDEGMELIEQIKVFVGTRIQIQFWHSLMLMCDEEGPFPLEGDCRDVLLLQHGEFMQAFVQLENIREIPTPEGCPALGYLIEMDGIPGLLAPVADIYEVWPVNPDGSVSAEIQINRIKVGKNYNERMLIMREQLKDTFSIEEIETLYPLWCEETKQKLRPK